MKKISIILSAALLAATFALAGCSNVSELNGSEWDIYSAGASGKTAAQAKKDAETAAATKAAKVTLTITDTSLKGGKAEFTYDYTGKLPESFTLDLAAAATNTTAVAANAKTLTITVTDAGTESSGSLPTTTYKNAEVKSGDKTIKFESQIEPVTLKYNGAGKGAKLAGAIS